MGHLQLARTLARSKLGQKPVNLGLSPWKLVPAGEPEEGSAGLKRPPETYRRHAVPCWCQVSTLDSSLAYHSFGEDA